MGESKDLIPKLVGMLSLRVKDERNSWFASFKYFLKVCFVIIVVPCALVAVIGGLGHFFEKIVNNVRAPTQAQQASISNHYGTPKDWFTNRCEEKKLRDKYESVLQSCATAGNIDRCVGINMGDESFITSGSCRGQFYAERKIVQPSQLQCLAW